jgi:TPR repeat protein
MCGMRLPEQGSAPPLIAQAAPPGRPVTTPPAHVLDHDVDRARQADIAQRFAAATPKVVVTPLLVGLNVLIFVLMGLDAQSVMTFPASRMIAWGADFGPLTVTDHQWWRLISNCFLHLGVLHLGCNMYALILGGLFSGVLFGFVAARPLELEERRALALGRALLLSLCVMVTGALLVTPLLGAERSGPPTLRLLAGLYYKGEGVRKDPARTILWLKKAAEQGDLSSEVALGATYYRGEGVAQDIEESMKWFRQAAEQGDLTSQQLLAKTYYSGEKVPKNMSESVKWLTRAAEQGDGTSQRFLGTLYYKGDDLPRDTDEAIKWWSKAAEQGDIEVQKSLAAMYYRGDGVAKDMEQAVNWLRNAGQQGDLKSQSALAQMYYQGEGVTADKAEAAKWYGKAAGQGDTASQVALGLMYARGDGVEQDKVQALKWLILGGASRPEARSARQALEQEMTPEQKQQAAQRAQQFMRLKQPRP